MTVRDQMREAFRRSGLRVCDVAARSGVSESTVLNIFRGRNVSTSNLFAVAVVIGLQRIDLPPQHSTVSPQPLTHR